MNPVEQRIRSVPDTAVYESAKEAFPGQSDQFVIAQLMRTITIVAVCWNEMIEDGVDPMDVISRRIFIECDELAGFYPWPDD